MSFLKSFSVFHIPPDGAEVTDGEAVSMRNASGADPHVGHAVVSGGAITGVNLNAATACFVDQGDSATVANADGTLLYPATANVAAGSLTNVQLGPDFGVVTASEQVTVTNGSSSTNGNVLVGNGHVVSVTLQTAALVEPNAALSVHNSTGSNIVNGATAHITGGTFDYVQLPSATDMISNGDPVIVTSAVGNNPIINVSVISGVLQAINVSPTRALVATNQVVIVRNESGSETVPGALILLSGSGDLDHVKMPADYGIVRDAHGLTVPVTGTYTNTITPQVNAAGVITGFTLS